MGRTLAQLASVRASSGRLTPIHTAPIHTCVWEVRRHGGRTGCAGNMRRSFDVPVECSRGHRFETTWIPGVSFTALRLGSRRYQWCPIGRHFALIRRSRDLTPDEVDELSLRTTADAGVRSLLRLGVWTNASLLLALAMTLFWAIGDGQLPPGTQLPTHFGLDGTPNGFASKTLALAVPAILALIIVGYAAWVVLSGGPRRTRRSRLGLAWPAATCMLLSCAQISVFAWGFNLALSRWLIPVAEVGLLLLVMACVLREVGSHQR